MIPPSSVSAWVLATVLSGCLMVLGAGIRRLAGKRPGILDYVLPLSMIALCAFMAVWEIVVWLAREGPR